MGAFPHRKPGLRALLDGYAAVPTVQGESGGVLTRFERPGAPALYLKEGTGAVADDIAAEFARLRWLDGRVACPAVLHFSYADGRAALLSSAVRGITAYDSMAGRPAEAPRLALALGRFLRTLHAIPLSECPFDASLPVRLAAARQRVVAGRVDEDDFGDLHRGWTADEVLRALDADLAGGLSLERVVTHGDFSLGNVLVQEARVSGVIDVGRLGVADPYQDLAILHDNLAEFGDDAQVALWSGYGLTEADEARRVAHLRLDELF